MKHRMKTKPAVIIYSINARCLDLGGHAGFFARRKTRKLYEETMAELSDRVLDLFQDVETFSFAMTDDGFHILIWAGSDRNRLSRVMFYIQSRFAETINRHLDRTGPVWDGTWSCDVIEDADE